MNRWILPLVLIFSSFAHAQQELRPALESTYNAWREAMIKRDTNQWQQTTAEYRRAEVRNHIVSEKKAFPASLFNLPSAPPSLQGLRFLEAKQAGRTAKSAYFGKVDFGIGGKPTENLIVLSFISERGRWLYDRADFVNLAALPEVRGELAAGKLDYLKETPEAQPTGNVPPTPNAVNPAKYIAKVYVFCPGREVRVHINKVSRHTFTNAKESEIVIGGAFDGPNEVQFATRKLDGGTGKEAMTIRVYLMSETTGVLPVKVYEYQVPENGTVKDYNTTNFPVDAAAVARLAGR